MVNLASVILVVGIGLTVFFRKDIADFLNSLKGFGQAGQAVGKESPFYRLSDKIRKTSPALIDPVDICNASLRRF